MTGEIVELKKDYHVVCDGVSHWKRQAQGSRLQAFKVKDCDCKKKSPMTHTLQGFIPLS